MNNQNNPDTFVVPNTQTNILIVDDFLENIRLLSSILEQNGYQTRKAISGSMALTAVEASPPSLILLDIRMPEMNGYEVCEYLKSNPKTAHIPIIFLSASEDVIDKGKAFEVGGADYITKPFYIEEVLARVKHQLSIITAQETISYLKEWIKELQKKIE
ncbi:response regulator [Anabaena catenula]|uniref:Response regulator n=1 Tax=Anabaena catenula FACHB-362 TaxID=2692877 RepID=A0ABR8J2Q0_9NOST|nr:response regulator [Anabaena catenula]MBD2691893.1 response regulator [Anabaena catenula FACHB-362]